MVACVWIRSGWSRLRQYADPRNRQNLRWQGMQRIPGCIFAGM
jgi:hypothetical protein